MLICPECGFDNLPVTRASIGGLAYGSSLKMVSRCHRCGAEVAKECPVCCRLHPIVGTVFCPVEGINIQDFLDKKANIEERFAAFLNLEDLQNILFWRRFNFWVLLVVSPLMFFAPAAVHDLFYPGHYVSGGTSFLWFFSYFISIPLQVYFFRRYYRSKIRKLWYGRGNKETLTFYDYEDTYPPFVKRSFTVEKKDVIAVLSEPQTV